MTASLDRVAYHEAGHAVAMVLAYRHAHIPPGQPSIKYVSIGVDAHPDSGVCIGSDVYNPLYRERRPDWEWRDAMEWQIVIDMAGGIAEAIYSGERRQREIMWFAAFNCGTDGDYKTIERSLADLRELTRRDHGHQRFAVRTLKLLLENWAAVEAVAALLIRDQTIPGYDVEEVMWVEPAKLSVVAESRT